MNIDKFLADTTTTKTIDFRGQELTVKELSYGEVASFSKMAQEFENLDAMESNKAAMGALLRSGIVEFEELTDKQLDGFSPVALKELNEAVLDFNGLSAKDEEGNA